jgi:hypothetical protein
MSLLFSGIYIRFFINEQINELQKMMALAYDWIIGQITSNIEIVLNIRLHQLQVTLQVIDIQLTDNILLGRSWIHSARVVTFLLMRHSNTLLMEG